MMYHGRWSQALPWAAARRVRRRYLHTLTLNAGPTAVKYALYDIHETNTKADPILLASGMVDRVGPLGDTVMEAERLQHATDALQEVIQRLPSSASDIDCIGHRVVHGGAVFTEPTLASRDVLQKIQDLALHHHNTPAVSCLQAAPPLFPQATSVAVFDTAFHTATMAPSTYRYAVPEKWYDNFGVRKYGYHGIRYQTLVHSTAQYLQRPATSLNMILMHWGAEASMCCIQNGVSIDTTTGLEPSSGLMGGKSAGQVDFNVFQHLASLEDNDTMDVAEQLTSHSGLLALSGGISSDMRVIKEKARDGNVTCQLARNVFVEQCRHYLGAYYVKLHGRVDAIVFSGGMGVNDTELREDVLANLSELHLGIDPDKNKVASLGAHQGGVMEIHPAFSKTQVLVVPVDEGVGLARQASSLVIAADNKKSQMADNPQEAAALRPTEKAKTNLFCHSLGHTYTANEELGLLNMFSATINDVGYFRPIGRNGGSGDYRIELMKDYFGLPDDPESMFGVEEVEAWELIASGHEDELYERILEKYLAYALTKEFVMISTFTEEDDSLHFAAKFCSALNVPAILLGDSGHDTQFGIAHSAFKTHGANCVGVVVSDVKDEQKERQKLQQMELEPVALLPSNAILSKRSMREAMKVLDDSVCLYGSEYLDSFMDSMRIYTVHVDDLLELVSENELVIINHKRVDSLMSLILAAQSSNAPTPAGLLFTLYKKGDMSPKIVSLLDGLKDKIRIPIVATSLDTIEAAKVLDATPHFLTADCREKTQEAKSSMETYLDPLFMKHFQDDDDSKERLRDIGPRLFQYSTFLKARQAQKTIVFPEGADARVVEAASILVKRKLCKVILVGDPGVISTNAENRRVSLDGITVVDPQNYSGLQDMIDAFVEARKKKGLTSVEAEQYLLQDVNYFGTLMMHLGVADGMVSGAMHSSANTIRPALQVLKTSPGAKLVSSIFFMLLEDGVKVFGDCAINTQPNAEQLGEIAIASAKTSQQFGIEPRVALLSYATGDSNKGELIDKVIEGTKLAKATAEKEGFMDPELIAGPLQFDAAVDPAVAAVKAKNSRVAGQANVLIFPDLNSGNNGYKAVQQASKTIAVGPILQGLRKPVNDLSRGATVDDIVNTAVITALQVQD